MKNIILSMALMFSVIFLFRVEVKATSDSDYEIDNIYQSGDMLIVEGLGVD